MAGVNGHYGYRQEKGLKRFTRDLGYCPVSVKDTIRWAKVPEGLAMAKDNLDE